MFWAPLFQTNRISRRINKLSENLTSLSIFTVNIKPFLWKYHILPTLFWAALILLRSKQRKYEPWNVYSPQQNGVFCDCFASFQLTKTFILKLKCSAFIRNTSFTDNWKGRFKNWVLVLSVRIMVPSGYWATYCIGDFGNFLNGFAKSPQLIVLNIDWVQFVLKNFEILHSVRGLYDKE